MFGISLVMPLGSAQLGTIVNNQSLLDSLQFVAGNMRAESLIEERVVLFFFLPEDCPGCDNVAEWAEASGMGSDGLVFVTNAETPALDQWIVQYPNLNVLRDTADLLAVELRVTEVPSVFMLDRGLVLNADYWPFHGGLDGLASQLNEFALGGHHSTSRDGEIDSSINKLYDIDFDSLLLIDTQGTFVQARDLTAPAVFIVCQEACPVCTEEAEYLAGLDSESRANLLPIHLVLVNQEQGISANTAETSLALTAWRRVGVEGVYLVDSDNPFGSVFGTPTHVVVGTDWRVDLVLLGFKTGIERQLSRVEPR